MTPIDFNAALQRTRCRADSRAAQAARRVLVDGLSRSVAAREAGISAGAVNAACRRIEAATRVCPTCGSETRNK